MELPKETVADVTRRLRRIEGQVRGLQQMLADGRDCREVVTQLSAANKALEQAGFVIVAAGLTWCLEDPERSAAEGYELEGRAANVHQARLNSAAATLLQAVTRKRDPDMEITRSGPSRSVTAATSSSTAPPAAVIDPQRDIDRVLDVLAPTGSRFVWCSKRTCTTTTSAAASRLARLTTASLRRSSWRRRVVRSQRRRRTATTFRVGEARRARPCRPRAHPAPSLLCRSCRRPTDRRLHRRVDALRQRRAHGPGAPRPHRAPDAGAVPLGPTAREPARGRSALPDTRLRQLLLSPAPPAMSMPAPSPTNVAPTSRSPNPTRNASSPT